MITQSQIYWLTKLDDIRSFFTDGFLHGMICVALPVGIIAWAALAIIHLVSLDEVSEETTATIRKARNFTCGTILVAVILGTMMDLAASFIPSTKQMAAIVVIPRIANSETVSELGDLGKDLIVLAKEWVEEIRSKKETK